MSILNPEAPTPEKKEEAQPVPDQEDTSATTPEENPNVHPPTEGDPDEEKLESELKQAEQEGRARTEEAKAERPEDPDA